MSDGIGRNNNNYHPRQEVPDATLNVAMLRHSISAALAALGEAHKSLKDDTLPADIAEETHVLGMKKLVSVIDYLDGFLEGKETL